MISTLALALLSFAQVYPKLPPPPDDLGPMWSIAAGLAAPGVRYISVSSFGLDSLIAPQTAQIAIEAKVAPDWWLMIEARGSFSREHPYEVHFASDDVPRQDELDGALLGGTRFVFAHELGFDFSTFALAGAGYLHSLRVGDQRSTLDVVSLEAHGGLAISRIITGGLFLRLTFPIITVSWSDLREDAGGDRNRARNYGVMINVLPAIEVGYEF